MPLRSTGIRLRLRFSRLLIGLGRVSLFTGSVILPKILGPSSFSALIFDSTNGASAATKGSGTTGAITGATSTGFSAVIFNAGSGLGLGAGSAVLISSFFLGPFLGRVEESIVDRSILLITLGPSNSGASILCFSIPSCFGAV